MGLPGDLLSTSSGSNKENAEADALRQKAKADSELAAAIIKLANTPTAAPQEKKWLPALPPMSKQAKIFLGVSVFAVVGITIGLIVGRK